MRAFENLAKAAGNLSIVYISGAGRDHSNQVLALSRERGVPCEVIKVGASILAAPGIQVIELEQKETVKPGRPALESGRLALQALEIASELIEANGTRGLVTLPLSKHHVSLGAPGFHGHTDFLAERFRSDVLMLMHGEKLSVIPLTVHIPIQEVSKSLRGVLEDPATARLLRLLENWSALKGAWALCGLNPHAGENGLLGTEELEFIGAAADRFRRDGIPIEGPLAADGIFQEFHGGRYRLVLACYHDQGLIPFKALEGRTGVNCTIGLPFPRTSPDHGTAFDLAGTGKADPTSFIQAFELVAREGNLWM